MKEILLLKYGEIILKGLNRHVFEDKLKANLYHRFKHIGEFDMYSAQSTLFVEPKTGRASDYTEAAKTVFGIASLSQAAVCDKDMGEISALLPEYLRDKLNGVKTFKVESKRSDKRFPLTSPQISAEAGGVILDAFPWLKVDVNAPDLVVYVEIRDKAACIHAGRIKGAGGLPVGTAGKAVTLLSGGIDSPVSSYLMARRGLDLTAIHFFSYPYTSERAKEKVIELADIVNRYANTMRLFVIPFTHIQEEIRDKCPEDFFTIVMRRFMMRIACRVARRVGAGALVTGESLGQVASQTMQSIAATDAVSDRPVFRPLIGLDKDDIVEISRYIGAFETSIQPYEDCCTVFTPRHPQTKPTLDAAEKAEAGLDVEALVEEAAAGAEIINPGKYLAQMDE